MHVGHAIGRDFARHLNATERGAIPAEKSSGSFLGKVVIAAVAAGVLAAAFSVVKGPSFEEKVMAPLNVACAKAENYTGYRSQGVAAEHALGVILKNPAKAKEVCKLIDNSVAVAVQTNQTNLGAQKRNFQGVTADNIPLYKLAHSLGVSSADATALVAQQYKHQQTVNASAHKTAAENAAGAPTPLLDVPTPQPGM